MSDLGILPKHKLNRPLKEAEKQQQLKIKKRLDYLPNHATGVIKMNATYLDLVDKHYLTKGRLTALTIFMNWGIFGSLLVFVLYGVLIDNLKPLTFLEGFSHFLIISTMFSIPMLVGAWMMRQECFKYTHYPMRFNRQNRMVTLCRFDGTFVTVPWNKLFFFNSGTPDAVKDDNEIYVHILSEDRQTVLETFSLPVDSVSKEQALGHWEFVRRYMEEGPEAFYYDPDKDYQDNEITTAIVSFCNDVDGKKESADFSHERIRVLFFGNAASYAWNYPFVVLWVWGRRIAMKTCRVPQWPAEVEAESIVADDDPYVVTAASNKLFSLSTGQELD